MKDIGDVIVRGENGISLTQSHYIKNILNKYDSGNSKLASTPIDPSIKLVKNDDRSISQLEYASVVGRLMYAVHCIRPDISYVVGVLSRFTSNPGHMHWNAIQRAFTLMQVGL